MMGQQLEYAPLLLEECINDEADEDVHYDGHASLPVQQELLCLSDDH